MILCHCNILDDAQIKGAIDDITNGSSCDRLTPGQIYRHLGCRPKCGRCREHMSEMIQDRIDQYDAEYSGVFAVAAE